MLLKDIKMEHEIKSGDTGAKRQKGKEKRNGVLFSSALVPLCFCVFSIFTAMAHAQPSPYFSEVDRRAIAQDIRGIKNPSSYLVIAIAPGFEDLASIANFRVGESAMVSVVFITNGEDIPSDLNGEMFYQLASRRKEESYQVLSYLGIHSYFLNIPVDEFFAGDFNPSVKIRETLRSHLDNLISQVRPDVVILSKDPLSGNKESNRLAYLRNLVVDDIGKGARSLSWHIQRIFIETEGKGKDIPIEQRDPTWMKTYSQMGIEAGKFYASLKYQLPLWNKDESHRYVQLYPETVKSVFPLDKGLPEYGEDVQAFLPVFGSILSIEKFRNREKQLSILHNVITELESFTIHHEHSLDQVDLRVLVTWKRLLERIRCAILKVSIPFTVSDTVITPVQVFFLEFGKLDTGFNRGATQVIFPGVLQKQWIVNEAQEKFYAWKDSAQLRVLSPRSIPLNSPETTEGFKAMQMRTPFTFIVVHRDSNPNHDFMFQKEIPLVIAPIRSVEVLSSKIAAFHDTSIAVRFRSNVRDKSSGVFYVNDSIVSSIQKEISLPGKNVVTTDTLPLVWSNDQFTGKDLLQDISREVQIFGGPKGLPPGQGIRIGSFMVRPLKVNLNIEGRAGFCSVIENSPVEVALRRLGASPISLNAPEFSDNDLSKYSDIIIDQFAFGKFLSLFKKPNSIENWINNGGTLIILPQYGIKGGNFVLGEQTKFSFLPITGSNKEINVDSTDKIFNFPNKIGSNIFSEEPFVISYGSITGEDIGNSKILVKSDSGSLLLEKKIGLGKIFYCAINLYPRLLNIDETSYKLLANLLNH